MSEQRLSEKNTKKFRKKFPDLAILKVTTWGHNKALWCSSGLFIYNGEKLEKNKNWDGFGRHIEKTSVPGKKSRWKSFNPGGLKWKKFLVLRDLLKRIVKESLT